MEVPAEPVAMSCPNLSSAIRAIAMLGSFEALQVWAMAMPEVPTTTAAIRIAPVTISFRDISITLQ